MNNRTNKKCSIKLDGMYCKSCEVLLEENISKLEGVKNVNADLNKQTIDFEIENNTTDINLIRNEIKKLGYKTIDKNQTKECDISSLTIKLKKENIFSLVYSFAILIIFFYLFLRIQESSIFNIDIYTKNINIFTSLILGILAGISTCSTLLFSIFISTVSKSKYFNKKLYPTFSFVLGRIISFGITGSVLGFFGSVIFDFNQNIFNILAIVISILMIIWGIEVIGVKTFSILKIPFRKNISKKIFNEKNLSKKQNQFIYKNFFIGFFTILLPCTFTLIAQMNAVASKSIITGSIIMITFAVGSVIPIILFYLMGSVITKKLNLTRINYNLISGFIIIFFALYTLNGQLNALGINIFSNKVSGIVELYDKPKPKIENGYQILNIIASNDGYKAINNPILISNQKAKLIIDNKGIVGCGSVVVGKGLFKGTLTLKDGKNIVNIENPKKGIYRLTCASGTTPPLIVTVV